MAKFIEIERYNKEDRSLIGSGYINVDHIIEFGGVIDIECLSDDPEAICLPTLVVSLHLGVFYIKQTPEEFLELITK